MFFLVSNVVLAFWGFSYTYKGQKITLSGAAAKGAEIVLSDK